MQLGLPGDTVQARTRFQGQTQGRAGDRDHVFSSGVMPGRMVVLVKSITGITGEDV